MEQARSWAKHRASIREKIGKPIVTIYEIDDNIFEKLNIKRFSNASKEWLEYITYNRTSEITFKEDYDIVIGPVANDSTTPVINLYLNGIITEDVAINDLKTYVLKDQYVIKTEKALNYLKYLGVDNNA